MSKYNCIIVEDQPPVAEQIAKTLALAHPDIIISGFAQNVAEAMTLIAVYEPQIVFLDIKLGAASGFDLLKQVSYPEFETIVITAYDQFVIEALRYSAADYLLKPVAPDDLQAAIERALKKLHQDQSQRMYRITNTIEQYLLQMAINEAPIILSSDKEIWRIKAGEVIMLEARKNYCQFYFYEGNKLLVGKGLSHFAKQLGVLGFIRCHAANLVNKQHIKKIKQADGIMELLLTNDLRVVVSRKYHKVVKDELKVW